MPGCSQPGPAVTVNIPLPIPNPPGMPRVQYQVIDANTAKIDVSWDPVPGATYYKVLVNENPVATVQQSTNTQITVTPGNTYRIQVQACN